MPTQHLGPPPAFKADNVIEAKRLADGDRWGAFWLGFGSFPGCKQGLVHGVDERWDVGWCNLVVRDVAADDLSNQGLDCGTRRVVAHGTCPPLFSLFFDRQN